MKRTLLALAVAAALMLAGCGGGSKTATMSGGPAVGGGGTPTPTSVAIEGLPTGHTLETGTIPAGQSRPVGEAGGVTTLVRCSSSEDCSIRVAANRAASLLAGSLRVETQTGTFTSGTIDLPTGHTLETGTIPAGRVVTVGEAGGVTTLVRCSGSEDCSIRVAANRAASLLAGSLRVETQRALITLVPRTPTPPTPIPGGGTPGGGTFGTTWEQLPSLVDRMDVKQSRRSSDFPGPSCDDLTDCQPIVKSMLAAATEPTGTMRRFQGTRTVQTEDGVSVTGSYWGGWLDNGIFITEIIPRLEPTEDGRTVWTRRISMGIRDTNPVAGVYRGEAVDWSGNWGTSELNYVRGATGGNLGLTINIPARGDRAVMRWSNIPVNDRGWFNNDITYSDNVVGPNGVAGHFYQGGELGGRFTYRWSLTFEDTVIGAFGAKRTP